MSSSTKAKERLDDASCSVAEQRAAWLQYRSNSEHVTHRLKGDCVVCGHKESAAIHSYGFLRGRAIPFHGYCPPNDESIHGGKEPES
jgi:hypothetical protein